MGKIFGKSNEKYNGLSESQRLQMRQFEVVKQKMMQESKLRMDINLEPFKDEYSALVGKRGIRHQAQLSFKEGTPDWLITMITAVCKPVLTLIECREELDKMVEVKKKESGVVR